MAPVPDATPAAAIDGGLGDAVYTETAELYDLFYEWKDYAGRPRAWAPITTRTA